MEKYYPLLETCPLFRDVSPGELAAMLNCFGARILRYAKGETIFLAGDSAKDMGILLCGSVHILQNDYYGNRSIISVVQPGELFLEVFACAEAEVLSVDAVASEASEVMLIEGTHILHTCDHHCAHHRRLIYNLMRELAQKNLYFHERIEVTSRRTTREKLLAYLTLCSKKAGSAAFTVPHENWGTLYPSQGLGELK
jgi:CRP-like cAMP-binding protein